MKHIRVAYTFVVIVAILAGPALAQDSAPDPRKLTYPQLHDIVIPQIHRVTLPNGIRLFLLEDHELPLVNVACRIRVGSIYEPADKIGLATITGEVMRTGGTVSMTGDQLDEELEAIAAAVETDIGLDTGTASVSVLKEDVDRGLAILADVLMNPAFRPEKIALAKMQLSSSIARRNDSPDSIASREFRKLIYGPESVYARHMEFATLANITRDDLIVFHERFFGPNNMMMAIWGDFETGPMIDKITRAFDAWPPIDPTLPEAPEVDYSWDSTVALVEKPEINQSNIYLGHIGGLRSDPDYFALTVMNQILGGGFTGRLFKNVRSRQGLAYSVFGGYSSGFNRPGMFYVGCQTKSQSTVHAIKAMIDEVKKITQDEVTDEELALAKDSYLNSFVFNFDSKGEIINRLMTYEYYGYPPDFLQRTKESIESVTKADVLRVAERHLRPDAMQILVVGHSADFDEPLTTLGTVENIDITIPPPPQR